MDDALTPALLAFFAGAPEEFSLACALLEGILAACPGSAAVVQKTQITLSNRYVFACISFAKVRPAKLRPQTYLVVTFGLDHHVESPRIDIATEPYPHRWTHHVLISAPQEIDNELLGWVREAYDFSEAKGRGKRG